MDADYLRNINAKVAEWNELEKGDFTTVHIDNGFIVSTCIQDQTCSNLWHFCYPDLKVRGNLIKSTKCLGCGVKVPKTVQAVYNLICLGI